jgi:hypothetical protein
LALLRMGMISASPAICRSSLPEIGKPQSRSPAGAPGSALSVSRLARVLAARLLQHQRLRLAGLAAAARDRLHRADDDADVLGRELAALEGDGGGGQGGELAGEADLGVGGAGADVEGVAEPGGAGQGHGGLAVRVLLDRGVEGADDAGDGRVDAVALGEGDLQEAGQLVDVEAVSGGAAECDDELLGARVEELGELRDVRTHVPSVAALAPLANPSC